MAFRLPRIINLRLFCKRKLRITRATERDVRRNAKKPEISRAISSPGNRKWSIARHAKKICDFFHISYDPVLRRFISRFPHMRSIVKAQMAINQINGVRNSSSPYRSHRLYQQESISLIDYLTLYTSLILDRLLKLYKLPV